MPEARRYRRAGSIAAAALGLLTLLVIVGATLGPITARPSVSDDADIERLAAFALLSGCMVATFPERWRSVVLAALTLAGILELAQTLRPDRHAQWQDLLVKGAGSLAGAAAVLAAQRAGLALARHTSASVRRLPRCAIADGTLALAPLNNRGRPHFAENGGASRAVHTPRARAFPPHNRMTGLPAAPGHYWARLLSPDESALQADERPPPEEWTIVEVFENGNHGDPDYLLVLLPGVLSAEPVENFEWGDGPLHRTDNLGPQTILHGLGL